MQTGRQSRTDRSTPGSSRRLEVESKVGSSGLLGGEKSRPDARRHPHLSAGPTLKGWHPPATVGHSGPARLDDG